MSFPKNDQYWADALEFLLKHHKAGETVIAPEEFSEIIPDVRSYAVTFASRSTLYPWAVIHKGMVGDLDEHFIIELYKKSEPVFANEVFAILSLDKSLNALDWDSPHLSPLRESIGRLKAWKAARETSPATAAPPLPSAPESSALRGQIEDLLRTQEKLLAEHAASIRYLTNQLANLRSGTKPLPDESLKVSIIMPVYNRAGTVGAAIESVLCQRYANRELIVVDDGSDDALDTVMAPYLQEPGVVYLKIRQCGACGARNVALKACTGDLIAYLDSDNIMYPDYLDAAVAVFAADPGVMCAHAAMLWDDGKNSVHIKHDTFRWDDYFAFKINLDINAFVHRREAYDKLGGFDVTLLCHGDHDIVLRYTQVYPVATIPAISVHYQAGGWDRLSTSQPSAAFFDRIVAKYSKKITRPLRVLTACAYSAQLSESYVDGEIRWMLRHGVEQEIHAEKDATGVGVASAKVHRGTLEEAIVSFRPDIIHFHWLSLAARHLEVLKKFNIPVTIRSHGFDLSRQFVDECAAVPGVRFIYAFPHQAEQFASVTKIKPLPVAFDSSRFYPRLGRDPRLVLRAGACLPTKDLATFFQVAARCPEYKFILALARTATALQLLDELIDLNKSLGSPVEMRIDVQYGEMALLTARAGVYLHTFGFKAPFGMPISIAESMACGAIPLVRDSSAGRAYAGEAAEYYHTADDAVGILHKMLAWSPEEWSTRSSANATHAYRNHSDRLVLRHILDDWQAIQQSS